MAESTLRFPAQRQVKLEAHFLEDDGQIVIDGTREDLRQLSEIIREFADNPNAELGSHIHIAEQGLEMNSGCPDLLIALQDANAFVTEEEELEEDLEENLIKIEEIYALQFYEGVWWEETGIFPRKLYPVLSARFLTERSTQMPTYRYSRGAPERCCVLNLLLEEKVQFAVVVHLDDPRLNFFSKEEVMHLAIRPL